MTDKIIVSDEKLESAMDIIKQPISDIARTLIEKGVTTEHKDNVGKSGFMKAIDIISQQSTRELAEMIIEKIKREDISPNLEKFRKANEKPTTELTDEPSNNSTPLLRYLR